MGACVSPPAFRKGLFSLNSAAQEKALGSENVLDTHFKRETFLSCFSERKNAGVL